MASKTNCLKQRKTTCEISQLLPKYPFNTLKLSHTHTRTYTYTQNTFIATKNKRKHSFEISKLGFYNKNYVFICTSTRIMPALDNVLWRTTLHKQIKRFSSRSSIRLREHFKNNCKQLTFLCDKKNIAAFYSMASSL